MRRFGRQVVCSGAVLVLAACGGDDGGDGSEVTVEFVTHETVAGGLVVGEGALQVDVARLELQLREIKVLPDKDEGEDAARFQAKGTFTLDLIDGGNNTVDFALPPGRYKKVEFKVDKPDDGGGIDDTDASLWFEGTKDGVKFRFLDDKMDKITLRDTTEVELEDGGSALVRVNLDVPSWLEGVDVAALTPDAEGVVVIDGKGQTKDAHDAIEENVKQAIKIARKPAAGND